MSSSGMSIGEHIDELRIRIIHIVICIAIITIFSMSFGIKSAVIPIELPSLDAGGQQNNLTIYYPYPAPFDNIALQLTVFMKDTLLPPEVEFIQTAPGQVFFAQVHISLLIGLICSLPVVIREIFGFFSPAFNQALSKRKTKDKGAAASGEQDSNDVIQSYEESIAEQGKKIRLAIFKIKDPQNNPANISLIHIRCSILLQFCNPIYTQLSLQIWRINWRRDISDGR